MRRQHTTASGIIVPMPYQDWLVYTLHIEHHQGPALWGGELNALTDLAQRPDFSLSAGENPAGYPQNA